MKYKIALAASALILAACASGPTIRANTAPGANLQSYKTYTFVRPLGTDRGGVETPDNAIPGIVAGLRGRGTGGTFEGVALYAEWTTDEAEWSAYERLWRGR